MQKHEEKRDGYEYINNSVEEKVSSEINQINEEVITKWIDDYYRQRKVGLIGGRLPRDAFRRKIKMIHAIKTGNMLYVFNAQLAKCKRCGFGNPRENVQKDKFLRCCIACNDHFEDELELMQPYDSYQSLSFDAWYCAKGHLNDLGHWECTYPKCRRNMMHDNSYPASK